MTATTAATAAAGVHLKQLLQEVTAQILLTAFRRVTFNRFYCALHPHDKRVVLEECWSELFILHASRWPINIGTLAMAASRDMNEDAVVSTCCESLSCFN